MMKTPLVTLAITGLLYINPAARAADTYNLDPAHSTIGFAVSHMVINTVKGRFNEISGTVVVDGNQITDAKGTIQTKSIDTGVAARDKHLRSPDFFDVEKFPTITFQAKHVVAKGPDPVVVGDFTMHGVTKEISLPMTVKGPIKDPMGATRIGLQAKTKLNRKDYGLTYNRIIESGGLAVGEEIEIEINAEAVKAGSK
jgi:polyisoprenoid-binding protein YceI